MFTEEFADHFGSVSGLILEVPCEYWAFCKLISYKPRIFEYILITAILFILPFNAVSFLLTLAALGMIISKRSFKEIIAAAIITETIFQLSFSFFGAISEMLFCFVNEGAIPYFGRVAMILGESLSVLLSVFITYLISNIQNKKLVSDLFVPILIIFIVGFYINRSILGNTVSYSNILSANSFLYVFIAVLLGMIGIYVLYIFSDKLQRFEYANVMQAKIIDDTGYELDRTKALKHDLKNHMTVLKELVSLENSENAKHYLSNMEEKYRSYSIYRTGSIAADIIITDKFSTAKEKSIETECKLKIPAAINDVDICILLGNALDNAINGCESVIGRKYIIISSYEKGDIYLIKIENSFNGSTSFSYGTGIRNMKKAAEKYGGYVNFSCDNNTFCTSIVLIISHH